VNSRADAVSADGSVIVGQGETAAGLEAMIWDSVHGMRSLQTVLLTDYGLDLTGWQLQMAKGVSHNGRVIAGYGLHNGVTEGFYVDSFGACTHAVHSAARCRNVMISWTPATTAFTLEEHTTCGALVVTAATGTTNYVLHPVSGTKFYRLRKL